jgi:hypothetical protein
MNSNAPLLKIAGLFVVVILLCITYSLITESEGSYRVILGHPREGFVEGNACNDVKAQAAADITNVLNAPIATTSDSPRTTAIDMISEIKKIDADVTNGTGKYKGAEAHCFPERVKLNLDLDMDPDAKIQKIRSSLVPDKPADGGDAKS